jgi:hypothetical protein
MLSIDRGRIIIVCISTLYVLIDVGRQRNQARVNNIEGTETVSRSVHVVADDLGGASIP